MNKNKRKSSVNRRKVAVEMDDSLGDLGEHNTRGFCVPECNIIPKPTPNVRRTGIFIEANDLATVDVINMRRLKLAEMESLAEDRLRVQAELTVIENRGETLDHECLGLDEVLALRRR